jgi:outer membrane immunogenic protein
MKFKLVVAGAALIAGSVAAQAADQSPRMPVKAAPVAQAFSWTGAYVGAHLGYGWSHSNFSYVPDPDWSLKNKVDGILGGGQIGYNYQTGSWVFGAEADFSWSGIKGTQVDTQPSYYGDWYQVKVDWTSTLTGRVGYAFDRSLLYVKGGAAWARTKVDYEWSGSGEIDHGRRTRTGWTLGAGLEYAFAPQWSARVEYDYMDFGKRDIRINEPDGSWWDLGAKQKIHAVKVGINFRPW